MMVVRARAANDLLANSEIAVAALEAGLVLHRGCRGVRSASATSSVKT